MREKAVEFLKQFTRDHTDCCINYKPYEHGSLVESIPFASAVENFITDYKENYIFLQCFDIEDSDKAFDMTCRIWKTHIVTF
jgi:hypothetical protein